mgnify:CR=1 FL=1
MYFFDVVGSFVCKLDELDAAAEKVNMIRQRTSVEMPPYTFASKEDGLNKIRNESRRELINESVNFYEELRWGTFVKQNTLLIWVMNLVLIHVMDSKVVVTVV